MPAVGTAAELIPTRATIPRLHKAAAGCTACPLHERATQTVFGDGPASAEMMLVGEQPGDREDREGEPFVGPAGKVLDQALEAAGIERGATYLTNVVKHFKWKPSGKRKLHQTPRKDRGRLIDSELAPLVGVTVHPSSILRVRGEKDRRAAKEELVADLAFMAREMDRLAAH